MSEGFGGQTTGTSHGGAGRSAESGTGGSVGTGGVPVAGGAGSSATDGSLFNGSSQHGGSRETGAGAFRWADENGLFSERWTDRLPEEIRGHASLKAIGTVQDLAKSYIHTKGMVGAKLEAPGEQATPEQIANWRRVVGAPERPEGYLGTAKSLRPEAIPEGLWDAEAEKGFLALAHRHHLPPAAVKDILGYHARLVETELGRSQTDEAAVLERETATLRSEWGHDFSAKLNVAARMAATVGLKTDDPIFTSARVVKAFASMAALISEDRLVQGDARSAFGGSVQERIRDITDPGSTSQAARAYRGDYGEKAQQEAQTQLHQLYAASHTK
jgi:hypothetical protein